MIALLAFYLFATVTITSAVLVIFARNPVHSVLWLILAFFNAAGLMLLVGAEFIAMLLVIVYVGAVAVLFLFVVMMLDVDFAELRAGFHAAPIDPRVPNIQALGQVLYTRYLYIFEGAGLVLLVAMIGAIVLTHRTRSDLRPQRVSDQVRRRPKDAVVNMSPGVGEGVEL